MAQYEFVATHGVRLSGDVKFERAPEPDTSDGGKQYRFVTDDAKVAERLRAVDDYGITEVGKPAPKRRAKSEEG